LGRRGERAAARHLKRHRYRILARNYRSVAGEIDLIASQRETIVFVEVKTRSSTDPENDESPVRLFQQRRIERAARFFLLQPGARDRPYRFDIVTVVLSPDGEPQIEHRQDAFGPALA
jgi:putative endonuclease